MAGGEGVTPSNGLYGEAPPKRSSIFFRLQVYERVGISLVKCMKVKRPKRADRCIFVAVKKSR